MATFSLKIENKDTGEYLTTHILDEDDLSEFAEYIADDTICTLEILDMDEWQDEE